MNAKNGNKKDILSEMPSQRFRERQRRHLGVLILRKAYYLVGSQDQGDYEKEMDRERDR